jgi:hypothetical protein
MQKQQIILDFPLRLLKKEIIKYPFNQRQTILKCLLVRMDGEEYKNSKGHKRLDRILRKIRKVINDDK